ncbi:DUF6247 family protein [Actinomadura sp. 3N407]|uniref:DUF6247 family protein n=1 Tax=Actinomadura sp. 3N407 TaxID=3457423 RepID=UPI003FCE3806
MTAENADGVEETGRRQSARANRREKILHVAMEIFAARGYNNASLAEVAAQVGLTQQGLLHYFPSKVGLLTSVLAHRDDAEIDELAPGRPQGLAFLRHLVETMRRNATQEGIVRLYTVLSAESVTTGHPAQDYFRDRYSGLRVLIMDALREARESGDIATSLDDDTVTAAIIAVMDGLQVQWLLSPETIDMATATQAVITALVGNGLTSERADHGLFAPAAGPPESPPGPPGKDLRSIRAALPPEDRAAFDSGLRRAMNAAADHLDLTPLQEFIETWWRIAVMSIDPDGRRAADQAAEAVLRGEPVPMADATEMIRRRLAEHEDSR